MFNKEKFMTKKFLLSLCLFSVSSMAQTTLPQLGSEQLPDGVNITPFNNGIMINSANTNNVIKWESFDVGREGTVYFTDDHSYLNLVTGGRASIIDGVVTSGLEGSRIYLVNPAGITVNGRISGFDVGLFSTRLTEKDLDLFRQTGSLPPDIAGGMGRVSLLGKINASNLMVNAGQIIIRDISKIKRTGHDYPLTDITLTSSVQRIDIGAGTGTGEEINLKEKYGFTAAQGVINHTGAVAVSTASELKTALAGKKDARVFLTNDIDLGVIDTPLDNDSGFSGELDGAFNSISYTFKRSFDGQKANAGLFSTIDGAKISALNLKASLSLADYGPDSAAGALAGMVSNSSIEQVRAYDTAVNLSGRQGANLHIGGLSGILNGGLVENTVSSLSESSWTLLSALYPRSTGALSGATDGRFKTEGLVAGLGDRVFGSGTDFSSVRNDFEELQEDLGIAQGFILDDQNRLNQKGFYDPFFMIDDLYYDYDENRQTVPSYRGLLFDSVFKDEVYAHLSVGKDSYGLPLFDENSIKKSGTYTHYLTSSPLASRGYYFVKRYSDENGKLTTRASHTGLGLITIGPEPQKEEVVTPSAEPIYSETDYSPLVNAVISASESEPDTDIPLLWEPHQVLSSRCSFCSSRSDFTGEIISDAHPKGLLTGDSLYPTATGRSYSALASPEQEYAAEKMQFALINTGTNTFALSIRAKTANLVAASSFTTDSVKKDETVVKEREEPAT